MPDPIHAAAVSPTAHYTGAVWARHRLSHPAFATREGRIMLAASMPAMRLSRAFGGPTLEGLLLARHRVIDEQLSSAIADGRVSQVIEIAAGLSPRGWRFNKRHGARLTYIEADLPGMAARKRALLARVGCQDDASHRVVDIDAFAASGPASLAGIAATLDPSRGTAIITEGLINYFPLGDVTGLWGRMATVLRGFPNGLYLSDLHVGGENRSLAVQAFAAGLSMFVRGRVHLHFRTAADATSTVRDCGFDAVDLLSPAAFADRYRECRDPAARLVRVIRATTNGRA